MTISTNHFALLSAVVFLIGLYGAVTRRHVILVLLALQVMLLAGVLGAVGFASTGKGGIFPPNGFGFAVVIVAATVAQIVSGCALAMLLWRRQETSEGGA